MSPVAARAARTKTIAEDGYHHQAIGSLQALGLAIAAALMTTGLLWVVL